MRDGGHVLLWDNWKNISRSLKMMKINGTYGLR